MFLLFCKSTCLNNRILNKNHSLAQNIKNENMRQKEMEFYIGNVNVK